MGCGWGLPSPWPLAPVPLPLRLPPSRDRSLALPGTLPLGKQSPQRSLLGSEHPQTARGDCPPKKTGHGCGAQAALPRAWSVLRAGHADFIAKVKEGDVRLEINAGEGRLHPLPRVGQALLEWTEDREAACGWERSMCRIPVRPAKRRSISSPHSPPAAAQLLFIWKKGLFGEVWCLLPTTRPFVGGAVLVSPRPFSPISALDLTQNTLTPPASPGHPAWRGRLCWPSVKRSLVGPLASGMEGVGGLCVCCISWRRDQGAQVWGQGPGEPREGPGGAVPSCPFALCCQVSPSGTFGSFYGSHLCSTVTCWLHPALFPGPPCPLLAEPQLSTCSASWNHLNSLDALFNKNLCQCQGHIPLFIATS